MVEASNYAKARGIGEVPLHYVIVKRRNHAISNAFVIQSLDQWTREKKMPTPGGDITASDIWKGQQEDNPPAEESKDEPEVQPETVQEA